MAKNFDLSSLKKQPVKKKKVPPIDEVVSAIHKEESRSVATEKRVARKRKHTVKKAQEEEIKESLKRITLDLPASLHTKLKIKAVREETTIRSFVIDLLEKAL